MNELRETGFMSNRGRQNAASFLINDLKQPWHLGAMYFEHHLIDYDVYSNYGNWTYLAGVGADPRNDRVFNLNRQAQMYDPDGEYVHQWAYT
jgi:deoxyribodipyrimidine photo-lyase